MNNKVLEISKSGGASKVREIPGDRSKGGAVRG